MSKNKLSKKKFITYFIINIIIVTGIIASLYQLYLNQNYVIDTCFKESSDIASKSNEIMINKVISEMRLHVKGLNTLLKDDISRKIPKEELINDIENGNSEKIFNTINQVISSLGFPKNSLIIGTLDDIIYNNSLDDYNKNEWSEIFSPVIINDIFAGNIKKLYVKYEDDIFKIVSDEEIISIINEDPSQLSSYDIIIPSQITKYGDIMGNSDIMFNDNNSISPYKITILYRENMAEIYKDNVGSFINVQSPDDPKMYIYYVIIAFILIVWLVFLTCYSYNDKLTDDE